jgi:hypothetical protein
MSAQRLRSATIAAMIALSFLLSVNVFADLTKGGKKVAPSQPPSQQQISGQLGTVAQVKILVNGNSTPSGATIFTGSQIQTPELIGATIIIDSLGRVDIAPKTTLMLSFTSESMEVNLTAGCAILSTEVGVSGLVKTPQGVSQKIGPEKRSFIDVCTGESGAASPIIGEGAAMKAGAGVCWAVGPPIVINSGLSPLWLLWGGPLAGAAIASSKDGRPDIVSASAP